MCTRQWSWLAAILTMEIFLEPLLGCVSMQTSYAATKLELHSCYERQVKLGQTVRKFNLKRESLDTITELEVAFGTTKLLPPFDVVPSEFKRGNDYTKLLDHLFSGQPLPQGDIVFREGFDDADAPALLNRVVMAHLRSFEPKHEHKIAGLGYLISQACEVRFI